MKRDFAVAVKAVVVKGDKVLVLRRSRHEMECSYMNKYQKWDLPGGGLHFYEKAEEGLKREILEETSLRVQVRTPVSMFDVIRRQVHLCIFTYVCVWEEGEVCLSEEHEEYIWMTEAEVEQSPLPFWMKRDLLRGLHEVGKNA